MTHECVSLCMHWQTVMSVTINHTFGASCQLTDLMHDMQRYCANVKCLKQFSKSVLRPVMWFCGYARTAVHLNTMFTRTQIIVEFVWWLNRTEKPSCYLHAPQSIQMSSIWMKFRSDRKGWCSPEIFWSTKKTKENKTWIQIFSQRINVLCLSSDIYGRKLLHRMA